jgi:hypothetical protein
MLSVFLAFQLHGIVLTLGLKLLDIEALKPFRPVYLRGLLRLAKTACRFPKALVYNDVVVVESRTAVTSGAFGDVWRGLVGEQALAMKVMRTSKRTEDVLRVGHVSLYVAKDLSHRMN